MLFVTKLKRFRGRVGRCGVVVGFATPQTQAVAGGFGCLTRVLCCSTLTCMLILDRDRQLVLSVARFQQLTAGHLRSIHFPDHLSNTPLDRTLKRLVERRFLARIERRMIGGNGAGSGHYVYQLGSAGWALVGREGRYSPYRAVNHHTLAIADAYVELLEYERKGSIEILGFHTEPDSWVRIEQVELRPDLFIEIYKPFHDITMQLWLEIDMGTERPKQIRQKLADYWHAYSHSSADVMPRATAVLFLSPDEDRAKTLRWIIEQGKEDAQKLFGAFTIGDFAELVLG